MHTIELYVVHKLPTLLHVTATNHYPQGGVSTFVTGSNLYVKGKAIPVQSWRGPDDSKRLRLPDFKTIGCFYMQEIFLVLISVRG
jgi:hypothetical protein